MWNNVIYTDPNVGKRDLRILLGLQHTDVWNNVIYEDPNVGKGVFGSCLVYNTLTCETTSFTKIRTSVSGGGEGGSDPTGCTTHRRVKQRHLHRSERREGALRILPGVRNNASNTPHNVKTVIDQRPLCATVDNFLCLLNTSTHFLYLGYVTIKKECK